MRRRVPLPPFPDDFPVSILVTGAAGFIGAHVCQALAARGDTVVGLDDFNAYYDPQLKRDRVAALCPQVPIVAADVAQADLGALLQQHGVTRIVHLAAQAGVRYSLENPQAYAHSNLDGFLAVLEAARHRGVAHLVYASSSSVYGAGAVPPFVEEARIDRPLSFYAATKAANEAMAYSYAHLYRIPLTGLRFFTVYGPWGRPDMAPLLFSRAVLAGRPIEVFNHGRMRRDFTHIDDIVAGVLAALDRPPQDTPPHRVYNLGNHTPEALEDFIAVIEAAAGRPAVRIDRDMQPGDMPQTMADTARAQAELGYEPRRSIAEALPGVVHWCRDYFGDKA